MIWKIRFYGNPERLEGMPKKKVKRTPSSRRKKRSDSNAKNATERKSPIPQGFGTITPYLVVNGAAQAIEFYKSAFGAKELSKSPLPDGKILNAILKIGDSMVMLSDEFPSSHTRAPTSIGSTTVALHIYSRDVDKLWEQALAAGARMVMPLDNQFWGERYGQVDDPFGHRWSVLMRIEMKPEEMEAKRQAAMTVFAQGQHPGYNKKSPERTVATKLV